MLSLMINKRGRGTSLSVTWPHHKMFLFFFKEGSFSKEILVWKRNLQERKFKNMKKYEEIQRNLKSQSKNQSTYLDGFMLSLCSSSAFVDIDAIMK